LSGASPPRSLAKGTLHAEQDNHRPGNNSPPGGKARRGPGDRRLSRELSGGGEDVGILRFDSKSKDTTAEPVNWDAFFDKFEESDLAFLYQEKNGGRKGKPVPYIR
jgi:hypothetical protein